MVPYLLLVEEGRKILEHPEYEERQQANRIFRDSLAECFSY
ncbi:MAG: hypothetical protein U5L96_18025 [Owenweeksia sp.]|nr:hypothetical protein [Owenweeksia sp.]